MEFGEKIKKRREELGYTQQDLADKLEMSLSVLNRIERGKSELRASKVPALCKSLKISVNSLFNLPIEPSSTVIQILLFAIQELKYGDCALLAENSTAIKVASEMPWDKTVIVRIEAEKYHIVKKTRV